MIEILSVSEDKDPEMKLADVKTKIENWRDPKCTSIEDELVSIIEIGPTVVSEVGNTKSPAQRSIQFLIREDSDEAFERERERIRGGDVRLMDGIMMRAGDKNIQHRGRRTTSAREREVQTIRRMARKEEVERRRSQKRMNEFTA